MSEGQSNNVIFKNSLQLGELLKSFGWRKTWLVENDSSKYIMMFCEISLNRNGAASPTYKKLVSNKLPLETGRQILTVGKKILDVNRRVHSKFTDS